MGKYVDKRLEELGAQRIFELGLGDDDGKYVSRRLITWDVGWTGARPRICMLPDVVEL